MERIMIGWFSTFKMCTDYWKIEAKRYDTYRLKSYTSWAWKISLILQKKKIQRSKGKTVLFWSNTMQEIWVLTTLRNAHSHRPNVFGCLGQDWNTNHLMKRAILEWLTCIVKLHHNNFITVSVFSDRTGTYILADGRANHDHNTVAVDGNC